MDVLNRDGSYISYRKTELIIGELFIPYQDKSVSQDGTYEYYFEIKSVAVGDSSFHGERYAVVPFSYKVYQQEHLFNILLLFEDDETAEVIHSRIPVQEIHMALQRGLIQIESLTFTKLHLVHGDTYHLNTGTVDREVFHNTMILEYVVYDRERNIPFSLVIPYNLLNFLIRHATENTECVELTLVNLFDGLRKYLFLILEGMQTFPWRLDAFFLYVTKRERQKCVTQLLKRGYVNIDQLASVGVALPNVQEPLLESLSKNNKRELKDRYRFYAELHDEDWFTDVLYSVKIAIGHLLFHDGLKLESLDTFYTLKDNIANLTDIDLLEAKPFDIWLQQADDTSLDKAVHTCGIPALACAFSVQDFQPEALEKVLAKLSKSGTKVFQEETDYFPAAEISCVPPAVTHLPYRTDDAFPCFSEDIRRSG